jgi:hypothetical protein
LHVGERAPSIDELFVREITPISAAGGGGAELLTAKCVARNTANPVMAREIPFLEL